MYHIGFYYSTPKYDNNDQSLILCCIYRRIKFLVADRKLIHRKYRFKTLELRNFNYPVLFSWDGGELAKDIMFIDELPIITEDSGNGAGFVLCHSEKETSILYNGQSVLQKERYSRTENRFNCLVLNYAYALKTSYEMSKSLYISADDEYSVTKRERVISIFKKHIDSVDLPSLLSSLKVDVWECQASKVGDDDWYWVYRQAELSDGTQVQDPYLQQLIGLGKNCIYQDRGYTSYFKRPDIPFGKYGIEDLELEKKKIISKYSREEHMAWLFYDQLFKQKRDQKELELLTKYKNDCINSLNEEFGFMKLNALPTSQFYGLDAVKILKLNNYLFRMQKKQPEMRTLFSGNIDSNDKNKSYTQIDRVVSKLVESYNVVIVAGNVEGAERLAIDYAKENCIELICDQRLCTLRDRNMQIDRVKEMCNLIDRLYLFGDMEDCLNKNLITCAIELNKMIFYVV